MALTPAAVNTAHASCNEDDTVGRVAHFVPRLSPRTVYVTLLVAVMAPAPGPTTSPVAAMTPFPVIVVVPEDVGAWYDNGAIHHPNSVVVVVVVVVIVVIAGFGAEKVIS